MKQTTLYIRFFAVVSKKNKQGYCPIRCIITYNKSTRKFSTGVFVEPSNWSKDLQRITDNDVDYKVKNGLLQVIASKLLKIELEISLQFESFTIDAIYSSYNGEETENVVGIVKYYYEFLLKLKGLVGKDITMSTWNKFKYVHQHLKEFVKFKYGSDVPLDKLKLTFIEEFEYWLKVTKNQKQITINKTLQRFRKPLKTALNEGLLKGDPFGSFKSKRVSNTVIFLDADELLVLENAQIKQDRLELVRKLFLFCCYSGLGYAEMTSLQVENIQKGYDGKDWINITRKKTSNELSVPLLPMANEMLLRLEFYENNILPKISNQKFNSYLKEIADILSIKKRLTHHVARKTFASTILLYNDVPMEIVQQLLGHSSITTTEHSYGKILKKQISKQMERFY